MKHHMHLINFKKLSKFELAVTIIGSVEPIAAIPQVLKVYRLQSATELFLWTWVFGAFASLSWATYGIVLKKPPLIIASSLWVIIHSSMAIAVLLYG